MVTGIIIGAILIALAIAYWKGGKSKENEITAKGAINVRKTEQEIADELDKIQAGRETVDGLTDADKLWDKDSGDPASNTTASNGKTKPPMGQN